MHNTRAVKWSLFTPNNVEYLGNLLTYDLADGLVRLLMKNGSHIVRSRVDAGD